MILSTSGMVFVGHLLNISMITFISRHFCVQNSIFILIAAVELFLAFTKMKPFYSKTVNTIAASTLGVYLIHENIFMRPFLWQKVFKNAEMFNSDYLFLHGIGTRLAVYIGYTFIEML